MASTSRTTQLANLRQLSDDDTPIPALASAPATDAAHWTSAPIVPCLPKPSNLTHEECMEWTRKFISSEPPPTQSLQPIPIRSPHIRPPSDQPTTAMETANDTADDDLPPMDLPPTTDLPTAVSASPSYPCRQRSPHTYRSLGSCHLRHVPDIAPHQPRLFH